MSSHFEEGGVLIVEGQCLLFKTEAATLGNYSFFGLKDLVMTGKCLLSGSARVFGYMVYGGFLNRVYGILQLKYGYSVYHFL